MIIQYSWTLKGVVHCLTSFIDFRPADKMLHPVCWLIYRVHSWVGPREQSSLFETYIHE